MNNDPTIDTQQQTLKDWIERLQKVWEAMGDPDIYGAETVQSLLEDLKPDPVLGNVFRLRLDTGHAIRITLEMCVVEPS